MEKIFTDEYYHLAKAANLDFKQMLELVNEASLTYLREIDAAEFVYAKIVKKIKANRKAK